MRSLQVIGFAKSFLAINLATELTRQGMSAVIYTDPDHPYITWNKVGMVQVAERSEDMDEETVDWLILDGTAHDFVPDGYLYGYTPDLVRAARADAFRQRSVKPTLLALVGYLGSYGNMFPADVAIPWDERQTSSILSGTPLAARDLKVGKRFAELIKRMEEVIPRVDRRRSG